MKQTAWQEEFDFDWEHRNFDDDNEGKDYGLIDRNKIKSFIQSLLNKQREEILDSLQSKLDESKGKPYLRAIIERWIEDKLKQVK